LEIVKVLDMEILRIMGDEGCDGARWMEDDGGNEDGQWTEIIGKE
jgi:hypothetical protein